MSSNERIVMVGPWRYTDDGREAYRALVGPGGEIPGNQIARITAHGGYMVRHRERGSPVFDDSINWVRARGVAKGPDDPHARAWCDTLVLNLGYESQEHFGADMNTLYATVKSLFASAMEGELQDWEMRMLRARIEETARVERQRLERRPRRGRDA